MADTLTIQVMDALGLTAQAPFIIPFSVPPVAATPTFLPVAGTYGSAQSVAISCTTPASTIYYTTDGTTPTFPITGTTQTYVGPVSVAVSETLKAIGTASGFTNSAVGSAAYVISGGGGGGAVPVFNFANYSGSPATIAINAAATFSGSAILLTSVASAHSAGGAFYTTQVNVAGGFTCTGSFTPVTNPQGSSTGGFGVCWVIQNCNSLNAPGSLFNGVHSSADANALGLGAGGTQPVVAASIAVVFDNSSANHTTYIGSQQSTISLVMNGGPDFAAGSMGFLAADCLKSTGLNLNAGNLCTYSMVYDSTLKLLDFTLTDTIGGQSVRKVWPVDIPLCIGQNTGWVGMVGGTPNTGAQAFNSLAYWTGFNTRLAAPTLSVPGGSYGGTQTVTISGPVGATIHYTTDGTVPTAASPAYSTALTISQNTYLQASAFQSGFTTSLPVTANYLIAASATINFASGFASPNGLVTLNGAAVFSGSAAQITTNTPVYSGSAGSMWYNAPVNVNTNWSTTFTIQNNSTSGQGLCFVIQNPLPATLDQPGSLTTNTAYTYPWVISGGINTVGLGGTGLGYRAIANSLAIKFDIFSGNKTGLFINGAVPGTGGTTMTGINLTSATAIVVTLSYNATTHVISLSVQQGATNFSTTFTQDVVATVSGSAAYVGFVGGTGGGSQGIQKITTWTGF